MGASDRLGVPSAFLSGPQLVGSCSATPDSTSEGQSLDAGFFRLGSPFPFSGFLLFSPSPSVGSAPYPSPSVNAAAASHDAPPSVRQFSFFTLGSEFPFSSGLPPFPSSLPTPIFRDLGKWLGSFGGRRGFVSFLARTAEELYGEEWYKADAAEMVAGLIARGPYSMQFGAVAVNDGDIYELERLVVEAQVEHPSAVLPSPPLAGRPPGHGSYVPLASSRCARRSACKRARRLLLSKQKKRARRRLGCHRALCQSVVSKKSHFKIGVWNTRGLGAPSGADPAAKLAERKWNCALLSDLRFPSNGVHEVKLGGYSWVLIHHGKVGVALDAYLAQRWRSGGAQLVQVQGWEDGVRALGLC